MTPPDTTGSDEARKKGEVELVLLQYLSFIEVTSDSLTEKQKERIQAKYKEKHSELLSFLKDNGVEVLDFFSSPYKTAGWENHLLHHKNPLTGHVNMVNPDCQYCKNPQG